MKEIVSEGLRLDAHFVRPATGARVPGVILLAGFPRGTGGAAMSGNTYPPFADRIANDVGWAALAFHHRGTAGSEGDFSIDGWLADIAAAAASLHSRDDISGVWLAGFRLGGSLAIVAAANDPLIRGIATFSAPASLEDWVPDIERFAQYCRRVGVIRSDAFPSDVQQWGKAIARLDIVGAAKKIAPRSLLLVHGSHDDVVDIDHARRLAAAAPDHADFRVIEHGAHRLRHDPRATAMLLGWLDRQMV